MFFTLIDTQVDLWLIHWMFCSELEFVMLRNVVRPKTLAQAIDGSGGGLSSSAHYLSNSSSRLFIWRLIYNCSTESRQNG